MSKTTVVRRGATRAKFARARELRRQATPEETILWGRLRGNQIGGLHFRRQHVLFGFIVDFYCHDAALVVEVDGFGHDPAADDARDFVLKAHGLSVLRFPNTRVNNQLAEVLDAIEKACRESQLKAGG